MLEKNCGIFRLESPQTKQFLLLSPRISVFDLDVFTTLNVFQLFLNYVIHILIQAYCNNNILL